MILYNILIDFNFMQCIDYELFPKHINIIYFNWILGTVPFMNFVQGYILFLIRVQRRPKNNQYVSECHVYLNNRSIQFYLGVVPSIFQPNPSLYKTVTIVSLSECE